MTLQSPDRIEQDVRSLRDHFIPIGREDLIALLTDEARRESPLTELAFAALVRRIDERFARSHRRAMQELIETYAPFDPDCILVDIRRPEEQSDEGRRVRFHERLAEALRQANFRRLTPEEISAALASAKALGMRLVVDFDAFAHLSVWVRGEHTDRWTVRRWYRLYRAETIDVPVHRRLVLVYQDAAHESREGADPDSIFLKVFKNIPVSDIDSLLPTCRVRLNWFDRGKIILPTLSGIGLSLAKVVKVGLVATFFTGVYGVVAFGMLIAASVGYSLRSFFGYLATKDKYQLNLTRHLYYQNLGNNVGVLFRLVHEAEEQEFRETLIAYRVLLDLDRPEGATVSEIDAEAERRLRRMLGLAIDFEIDDALAKLERFDMATRTSEGRWRAVPIEEAAPWPDEPSAVR